MSTIEDRLKSIISMLESEQAKNYGCITNLLLSYLYDILNDKVPSHVLEITKKPRKVIYIAGPIRNGGSSSEEQIKKNVNAGLELMRYFLDLGYAVVCPHLHYFAIEYWQRINLKDVTWEEWIRNDLEILKKCDCVFYMKPELYGESKGAKAEIDFCKRNKILVYNEITKVPDLTKDMIK